MDRRHTFWRRWYAFAGYSCLNKSSHAINGERGGIDSHFVFFWNGPIHYFLRPNGTLFRGIPRCSFSMARTRRPRIWAAVTSACWMQVNPSADLTGAQSTFIRQLRGHSASSRAVSRASSLHSRPRHALIPMGQLGFKDMHENASWTLLACRCSVDIHADHKCRR